jgi:uncharacterized protein (DUF1800 family)
MMNETNKMFSTASIAVNRFGYGCTNDELQLASKDVKAWCANQLEPIAFSKGLPSSSEVLVAAHEYRRAKKQAKQSGQALDNKIKKQSRTFHQQLVTDTIYSAVKTEYGVSFRLFDFLSNHFSVSAQGRLMVGLAPTLEREAIAPNLLGNFEDLLLAVVRHPAMLVYLNNEQSFGHNSKLGKRKKSKGLNENLAREILELHTLGVDGGYTQSDVIALAKALTGWSVARAKNKQQSGFQFRAQGHEPGSQTLLGKQYPAKGKQQAQDMLRDLARNPKTASYVCQKLLFHFVGEDIDKLALNNMTKAWAATNGNIKQVMLAMFNTDSVWQLQHPQKFKTPRDFVISAARLLDVDGKQLKKFSLSALINMGQKPLAAGSPAGYNDDNESWLTPSALMVRADWAMMVASRYKRANTESLMQGKLAGSISDKTYLSVVRAESREQGLALLLMSPEFQWR